MEFNSYTSKRLVGAAKLLAVVTPSLGVQFPYFLQAGWGSQAINRRSPISWYLVGIELPILRVLSLPSQLPFQVVAKMSGVRYKMLYSTFSFRPCRNCANSRRMKLPIAKLPLAVGITAGRSGGSTRRSQNGGPAAIRRRRVRRIATTSPQTPSYHRVQYSKCNSCRPALEDAKLSSVESRMVCHDYQH